jgi:hypothetical protein
VAETLAWPWDEHWVSISVLFVLDGIAPIPLTLGLGLGLGLGLS